MKKVLTALLVFISFLGYSQVTKRFTTPQDLPNLIPGYSQVSSINMETLSFSYTLQPPPPDPIDGDTTTEDNGPLKYGEVVPVNFLLANGNFTQTTEGKVWTLSIKVLGSKNIALTFDSVTLDSSAELYLYNESKTILMGPVKAENLSQPDIFTTGECRDSIITVYVIERNNFSSFQSNFIITSLVAGFLDIDNLSEARISGSQCMEHVQCFPDKMPYAHAVARIEVGGYAGTGTLINNEDISARPYFLTSFHLIDKDNNNELSASEIAAANAAVFVFQFWRNACNSNDINGGITFSRAILRATRPTHGASDMVLLEIVNYPGLADGVVYTGWNRTTDAPSDNYSFVIHHPLARDMRLTKTTRVNNYPLSDEYWRAFYQDGSAVTRGSSGGPLFNQDNQVVGQLYGGWSSCTFHLSDRYGKFSKSWNGGSTNDTRLSNWISPTQNLGSQNLFDPVTTSILGADVVPCNTTTQYTVSNNLFNVTYFWEVSNNLQIVSGQGTRTISVTGVPTVGNSASVKVTIRSARGINRTLIRTRYVSIGVPNIDGTYNFNGSESPIHIWFGDPFTDYNSACNLQMTTTNMNITGATSVVWTKLTSNPSNVSWGQTGNNLQFYFWNVGQTAVFRVTATGPCGSTYYDFGFKSVDCSGGGGGCARYTISPNPAKSTLKIGVPSIPPPCRTFSKISKNSDNTFSSVKIYDLQGNLKSYQQFYKAKSANLDVSRLNTGTYFVEISDGKYIERKQLLIKK